MNNCNVTHKRDTASFLSGQHGDLHRGGRSVLSHSDSSTIPVARRGPVLLRVPEIKPATQVIPEVERVPMVTQDTPPGKRKQKQKTKQNKKQFFKKNTLYLQKTYFFFFLEESRIHLHIYTAAHHLYLKVVHPELRAVD